MSEVVEMSEMVEMSEVVVMSEVVEMSEVVKEIHNWACLTHAALEENGASVSSSSD